MKRWLSNIALTMVLLLFLSLPCLAAQALVPGGQLVALELSNDTVTIAAFDDTCSGPARDAGLQVGDQLLAIGNQRITCAEDVRQAMKNCGTQVELKVLRGSREETLVLSPAQTEDGPRLGVYLRQGIAGIGTVTWYDPQTHRFGTLGHGVNDSSGVLMPMARGRCMEAGVASVKPGKAGEPGQLRGKAGADTNLGTLEKNTPQGVFGVLREDLPGDALELAPFEEIHTGPATIRSTVGENGVQEYSVEILKIYPKDRTDCRNFLLRVTDPQLLNTTGGIVQGMSGSPIIQDGKLIGAVTHVLVNDPTRGYGIFIENMLDAAS